MALVAGHRDHHRGTPAPEAGDEDPPPFDVLIEQALTSGDAHALKVTEAALRCYARTKEPALLHAAADASARLRE